MSESLPHVMWFMCICTVFLLQQMRFHVRVRNACANTASLLPSFTIFLQRNLYKGKLMGSFPSAKRPPFSCFSSACPLNSPLNFCFLSSSSNTGSICVPHCLCSYWNADLKPLQPLLLRNSFPLKHAWEWRKSTNNLDDIVDKIIGHDSMLFAIIISSMAFSVTALFSCLGIEVCSNSYALHSPTHIQDGSCWAKVIANSC